MSETSQLTPTQKAYVRAALKPGVETFSDVARERGVTLPSASVALRNPNVSKAIELARERRSDKASGVLALLRAVKRDILPVIRRVASSDLSPEDAMSWLEKALDVEEKALKIREIRGDSMEDNITAADHQEMMRRTHRLIGATIKWTLSQPADKAKARSEKLLSPPHGSNR